MTRVGLGLSSEPLCAEFAGFTHLELRNTELVEMEVASIPFLQPFICPHGFYLSNNLFPI